MSTTKIRSSIQLKIDDHLDLNNKRIINLAYPDSANDAATKQYVDSVAQGLNFKKSCRVATTGPIMLNNPGSQIDGITLQEGDRILIKNQVTEVNNGIYIFKGATSPLDRAEDFNEWSEVISAFVFVEQGTQNGDTAWVCTSDRNGTIGVTPIIWTQFSSVQQLVPGDGIEKSGNIVSVKLAINSGLEFDNGGLRVKLDGSTLTRSNNGLKVTDNIFQPLNNRLTQISITNTNGFLFKDNSELYFQIFANDGQTQFGSVEFLDRNENGQSIKTFRANPYVVMYPQFWNIEQFSLTENQSTVQLNKNIYGNFTYRENNITADYRNTIQVFLNGLLLKKNEEYQISNTNIITFLISIKNNDLCTVIYYSPGNNPI